MRVRDDVGQQGLDGLQPRDRMAELHAVSGISGRMLDRGAGDADRLRGLGDGADGQKLGCDHPAAIFRSHHIVFGDHDVAEFEMSDRAGPKSHGFQTGADGQALGSRFDDEAR